MSREYADCLMDHLGTIGAVPVGGRLTIWRGRLCTERPTRTQWLSRMWRGESRHSTLPRVRAVAAGAVSFADALMSTPRPLLLSDVATLGDLAGAMEGAECGLRNLRGTYAEDESTQLALLGISDRLRSRALVTRAFLVQRAVRQAAMTRQRVLDNENRVKSGAPSMRPCKKLQN